MTFKDLLNTIINGSDEERQKIFSRYAAKGVITIIHGIDENGNIARIRIHRDGSADVESAWEDVPGATLVSIFREDGSYETDIPCFDQPLDKHHRRYPNKN